MGVTTVTKKGSSVSKKDFLSEIKAIESLEGWRPYQVLSKFLTCAHSALSKPTLPKNFQNEREQDYMRIVLSCTSPARTMRHISNMMGILTLSLEESLHDFLGPVFMEVSASKSMGQFFTPESVCNLAAEISLKDMVSALEKQSHIMIDEPASGSGAMLIACCNLAAGKGINYQEKLSFSFSDLDKDAYMSCYIQMSLAGCVARSFHRNSLSMETFSKDITPMSLVRPHLLLKPTHN